MSEEKKELMKPEALIDMGYKPEQLREFANGLIIYLDTLDKPEPKSKKEKKK